MGTDSEGVRRRDRHDIIVENLTSDLKAKTLSELHERFVKSFMDILVLAKIEKNGPMSGYDVIAFVHKKFNLLVSPGAVYYLLYSLERDGLIKGTWSQRKRVYALTDKGEEIINEILNARERIQGLMSILFTER